MPTRDEILANLKEASAPSFVAEHFFDRIPQIFAGDRASYVDWKTKLASRIRVDPACVTIVGSSAIGISLNPSKAFKAFDADSDIDVAIISNRHFSIAWHYLRTNKHMRYKVDEKTRVAWDEHVSRFIFHGTIATDKLLGILPFGKAWLDATGEMARCAPTIGRDINLRIYADHDALRSYQTLSAGKARDELISGGQ